MTLAILAGGQGRRMGMPKGQLRIHDQPILAYLLDRCAWPGPTLLVTSPGIDPPPEHDRFDLLISDPVAGQGPLRGVLTALEHATTTIAMIITVDMPELTASHLVQLTQTLVAQNGCLGVMYRHEVDGRQMIEPFPLACRTEARAAISEHMAEGRRAVHSLVDLDGFLAAPAPSDWPQSIWLNLNTPEDMDHL